MAVTRVPTNDGSTRVVQEPDFSTFPEFETRDPRDIHDEVIIVRDDYNSPARLEYRKVYDSATWTGRRP